MNWRSKYDEVVGGSGSATGKGILIRVRNAGELAASQSALAPIANVLAPGVVESKVYDEMAKQLKDNLAAKGVDADVSIVEPKNFTGPNGNHVTKDVVTGLVVAGGIAAGGALLFRLFSRPAKRKGAR